MKRYQVTAKTGDRQRSAEMNLSAGSFESLKQQVLQKVDVSIRYMVTIVAIEAI